MVLTTVLLFYLAFPSGGFGDLSWITLVPIIVALNKSSSKNAFMLGLLAATLGWMCSIWWAVNGISEITSTPINLAIPIVFIFCLLSAVPYAFACWLHVRLNLGKSIIGALISAVIFTVLINYIPHILPGNLAHALYQRPLFIQLADIGGVPLVFFIIHSVNFLLANGITLAEKNKQKAKASVVLAVIIFLGNIGYGQYRIQQSYLLDDSAGKKIRIAIIQPNIDIKNRTRNDWFLQQNTLKGVLNKLEVNNDIDLVVLPEIPVPISYQYYSEDKLYFDRNLSSKPLLLTTIKPVHNTINDNSGYFNTMELVIEKEVRQQYSKQVLLPFGEYIPFEKKIPWLRDLFPYAPNYQRGKDDVLFAVNSNDNVINVIPLICYEAVFSDIVGKGVKEGGELLINSSNDGWFNDPAGNKTHYALSLFRSIEYRKYLVRVTNTGISGIITPYGDLLDSSMIESNTLGYAVSELNIKPVASFYSNYPNLINMIFLSLFIFTFFFKRKLNVDH